MTESPAPTSRPVALITGASRGIGRGCALALADKGFDIVTLSPERDGDAEETLRALAGRGARAHHLVADIAEVSQSAAIVEAAFAVFGQVTCLVNNAGVSVLQRGDMLEASIESFDRCLGVNLRGTFFLTQAFAKRLLATPAPGGAAPGGAARSIITITSVNAAVLSPERAEYCVSKAGLAMMSKLFAVRLAEAGIAVYDVRPGIIRTDMTRPSAERFDRLIAEGVAPIRRWGEAEADVGRTVALLAGGALPFSVGQEIYVDGGLAHKIL